MINSETKFKETEIGSIPEEWDVFNVGKIGRVVTGKTPPTSNIKFYGDDYPFVKIPDMNDSVFITKTGTGISEAGAEYLGNAKLPENSIMVSCIATIGNVGITSRESFSNQQINALIPNKNIADYKYLYYFFKNNKELLESLGGGGSVYTNISKSKFESMPVVVPKLNEQKNIAEILSSLDDKIELNRQINSNLEKFASSLFKQWFINFEFSNENGKPYESSGGEMINSELGEIPEGWDINNLGNFVNILNGFAFKSSNYVNDGIFLLRTSNFEDNGYANNNDTVFLPNSFVDEYRNYLLKKFDVLLVMVGASVGKMSFVTSRILPALQNQNMWNFRAIKPENQLFIKLLIQDIVRNNIGSASGSARDFFRKDFFKGIKFIEPKQEVVRLFVNTVSPMYDQIDKNILEIDSLSKIRDSLLPRLMSGKIRA